MELIWIARVDAAACGTRYLAFRGEMQARAWVKTQRALGRAETYSVWQVCLNP